MWAELWLKMITFLTDLIKDTHVAIYKWNIDSISTCWMYYLQETKKYAQLINFYFYHQNEYFQFENTFALNLHSYLNYGMIEVLKLFYSIAGRQVTEDIVLQNCCNSNFIINRIFLGCISFLPNSNQ